MAEETLYLLDTNILIHDSKSIFKFGRNRVGIPFAVLEELDEFKKESSERGRAAREVIRDLDTLRARGFLGDGVSLDTGGVLQVFFPQDDLPKSPRLLNIPDNDIIRTALSFKKKGHDVRFVSKDLNARLKADVLGIPAEDYLKSSVQENDIYKGWVTIEAPAAQLKKTVPEELESLLAVYDLTPNEFIFMQSRNNPYNFRLFRYLGGKRFKDVVPPVLRWPVVARNPQQLMALDLLFDPEIKLVSLIGPAGTGKTFLALLAGLHQVLMQDEYRKVLASRPVIPLGPDIGYLPGDIQEKLRGWMQPMYDTIDLLAYAANVGQHVENVEESEHSRKRRAWKKSERGQNSHGIHSLDQLIREGKVSLEAITYMRGRSIPYQFILIDEVQNLNPHEVKTLVSRVGEGSKIILAGDPFQIDSPYLDLRSNGLVVINDKFKGQALFGSVFLHTSERSELSKLVSELL